MATMRRGTSPTLFAGARLSSHGRASATPAPRRNILRSMAFVIGILALLGLEQGTLDHFVDDRLRAVPFLADAVDDLVHGRAVGELHGSARGVHQQLPDETARERVRVGDQQ